MTPGVAWIATALTILLISAGCSRGPIPSTAFMVDIAMALESCGDGRYIVAAAVGAGRARLNGERDVRIEDLASEIHEALKYRSEKLACVTAEGNVSWGDFLQLVENVWPEADLVSVITPEVKVLAQKRYCLAPSCGTCEKLRSIRTQ